MEEGGRDADGGGATEGGGVTTVNPLLDGDPMPVVEVWVADAESVEDLRGQVLSDPDRRLLSVYGNTVHRNDGRHLHGGVEAALDEQHMAWFDQVVAHPHRLYFPPNCAIGKRFVDQYEKLWAGVLERKWNSEFPEIFAACILRRRPGIFKAKRIKQRIEQ